MVSRLNGKDRGLESYKGLWRARLMIDGRMWRSRLVQTKTEAKEIYESKKADHRRALYFPDRPAHAELTVTDLFVEYLPLVKEQSDYRGQQRFAAWWVARWQTRLVYGLTVKDLEDGRRDLRDGGRSIGTVNHYLKCLRHAMRRVVTPRSLVIDLWAHFKMDAPESSIPATLSPEQESRLQAQLGKRDYRIVRLAVILGLRRGQFFGLRWEWVLWDLAAITIPAFKRQPARAIPIASEGVRILKALWTEQGKPSAGWLFPHATKPGEPVVANDWYRYHFKKAARRAGLYQIGVVFHSLRHTWATRQLQTGANIRTVQRGGGWSSLKMVEKYTQAFDQDVRRAVECAASIGPGTVTRLSSKKAKRIKPALAV